MGFLTMISTFAIGIALGVFITLAILYYLNKKEELEFEDLDEIFTDDGDFIPEDDEIDLERIENGSETK